MAKVINTLTSGMSMPTTTRMYAQPLDVSGFFTSLAEAQAYAAESPIAYVGQELTVYANGTVDRYIITSAAGALTKIPTDADLTALGQQIGASMSKIGFKGTVDNWMEASSIEPGQIFVWHSEVNGRLATLNAYFVGTESPEDGDIVFVKAGLTLDSGKTPGVDAWTQLLDTEATNNSHELGHFLLIWERNLTGAMTTLSGGSAQYGKAIVSLSKQQGSDTMMATLGNMPRRRICVLSYSNQYAVDAEAFPWNTTDITVFLNGIRQKAGEDYTVTAASSQAGRAKIVPLSAMGLEAGDELTAEFLTL